MRQAVSGTPSRGRRFLRRALKLVAALIVIFAITYFTLLIVWGKAVDREIAAIRAEPPPPGTTQRQMPSQDENGAILYMKGGKSFRFPDTPSGYTSPDVEYVSPTTSATLDERQSNLVAFLRQNDQALGLLETASRMSYCVFPLRVHSTAQSADYTRSVTKAIKVLAARAALRCRQGQTDAGIRDMVSAIRLARAAGSSSTGYGYGLYEASLGALRPGLTIILTEHQLSEGQVEQLYEELCKIRLDDEFAAWLPASIRAERSYVLSNIDRPDLFVPT